MSVNELQLFEARDLDCGCGSKGGQGVEELRVGESESLPSEAELSAALESLEGESAEDPFALELEAAEELLSPDEELAFAASERADIPSLQGLLAIAERYPGLKITFSF
jgi:hypothetical protein